MSIEYVTGYTEPQGKLEPTAELQRALKHLERLRIALDQHAIVSTTDASGRITYANQKFCELSKYTREELVGQNHRIINSGYHPKSFFQEMWRTIGKGQVWRGEIRNRAKDGDDYWVAATIVPITDQSGDVVEYVSIRTDITEHHVARRRLAEMYKTAHKFVDHVSHEFRTPLTVIREFASIIHDGLAGVVNEEQREYLDIVINRVDDLSMLVDDMLDTSKLEAGILGVWREDCQVVDIIEHVQTTLERRATAVGARLLVDIPPDLPPVHCDAEKIGRVITNLVVNALKFCGEAGEVVLSARPDPENCEVIMSVTDNGPGIARESLETLFERFRQVGEQFHKGLHGFGLGLSIAKELVNLNFGDITVESQLGAGSTFSFTVPYAERRPLLLRYLRRVESFRNGSSHVTLLRVTSQPNADSECLTELERLIQRNTRRGDLLFRIAPHRWLLVAASNQSELQQLVDRVQSARTEANQNSPCTTLPEVEFDRLGSWRAGEERGGFVDRFVAAQESESAHV